MTFTQSNSTSEITKAEVHVLKNRRKKVQENISAEKWKNWKKKGKLLENLEKLRIE